MLANIILLFEAVNVISKDGPLCCLGLLDCICAHQHFKQQEKLDFAMSFADFSDFQLALCCYASWVLVIIMREFVRSQRGCQRQRVSASMTVLSEASVFLSLSRNIRQVKWWSLDDLGMA